MASAQEQENEEEKRRRPPVVTMEETLAKQLPVDGDAGADLPPSYTEVQEGYLPGYDTIPEKTRREVKYKLMLENMNEYQINIC